MAREAGRAGEGATRGGRGAGEGGAKEGRGRGALLTGKD